MSSVPAVSLRPFGQMPSGAAVNLYTLCNSHGLSAAITNYGGTMVSLCVPDRAGKLDDVLLGYDSLEGYRAGAAYFGALIGRVGNRIAHGRFTLEGRTYTLATNNNPGGIPCGLHGGPGGFDKVVWAAQPLLERDAAGLELRYRSVDGEEGYPGNLDVTVRYWLTDAAELKIEYRAATDRATPVNLTQHNYYNLRGAGHGDVLGHELTLRASRMTPVNAGLIPTGAVTSVAGTPFDFTRPTPMGAHIDAADDQLRYGGGYDHNWVLDRQTARDLELAGSVYEPTTGRVMELWTEEPGLQFYSGNFLDGATGKGGRTYARRSGFCLETQHAPDSPNQPAFPSIILRPGEVYRTTTVYRFSAR